MKLLRKGSSKDIYQIKPGVLGFDFTDYFSVFDVGRHPQAIPGKGKAMCDAAVAAFKVAQLVGVPTAFRERVSDTMIAVDEFRVIADRPLTHTDNSCLIPLEWIDRARVSGSIYRDFTAGKKDPRDYGFPSGYVPREGDRFGFPVHQLTTKFEPTDRELGVDEAMKIAALPPALMAQAWGMIDVLNGALALTAHVAGLIRFDGKKELAFTSSREVVVADVFGTPDEDRYVEVASDGSFHHIGKEFLRGHFIRTGYRDTVKAARAAGKSDPPYPELPEGVLHEVAMRYYAFARGVGGAIRSIKHTAAL